MSSIYKIIFFLFFCIIVLFYIDKSTNLNSQEFEGKVDFTVGQTTRYFFSDGFKDCIEYKYYIKGREYNGCVFIKVYHDESLGRFYKVKYLETDPRISILYLKEQILDSLQISKAGYTGFVLD